MAGSEASGVQAANASLFQGARILVCDLPENTPAAVAAVESFWLSLGGQPTRLPLQDHDAVLAAISHFPHLLAYGLAGLLAHTPVAGLAQILHGGGLRDTTRIAASSPSLWADILLDNRAELLPLLSAWEQSFGQLSKAVAEDDRARLVAFVHAFHVAAGTKGDSFTSNHENADIGVFCNKWNCGFKAHINGLG
jgi:prephenate dehydrogenase